MNIRNIAWIVGGLAVASAGLGLAACSDTNNTVNQPAYNGKDSGADSTSGNDGATQDTGGGSDGAGGGDSQTDGSPSDGGTADCGNHRFRPTDAGPLFCPHIAPLPNDGGFPNCVTATEHCCVAGRVDGGFPASTCETTGTPCPYPEGGTDIECHEPSDCRAKGGSATKCCIKGPNPTSPSAACSHEEQKFTESLKCRTACESNEREACTTNADCSSGKTCQLLYVTKGMDVGYCK